MCRVRSSQDSLAPLWSLAVFFASPSWKLGDKARLISPALCPISLVIHRFGPPKETCLLTFKISNGGKGNSWINFRKFPPPPYDLGVFCFFGIFRGGGLIFLETSDPIPCVNFPCHDPLAVYVW